VSTFFARDIRGLIQAGVDVEIFPVHPVDPALWKYVPGSLGECVLPRSKVHHVRIEKLPTLTNFSIGHVGAYFRNVLPIGVSAIRYGLEPTVKTAYTVVKAWAAAHEPHDQPYDHILSYWGSYAATYAYLYHSQTDPGIPFSMFLHAGDLYDDQVYLQQKLLHADNVFVVCEFNREFIRNRYPEIFPVVSKKIHVYHPSLDFTELPYHPGHSRSRRILAVGRFDKCKGFDYLIQAVHYLVSAGVDVETTIIGDGDEAGSLIDLAKKLGIQHRVYFRGWLHFDEVKNAMQDACMLVHPSSELGDAVPTVIKEALALGTPVIATRVAGIPELLDSGRCGILVPPRDVQQLADAIRRLLMNPRTRDSYSEKARKYAEDHFDLFRNGERLASLLRSTPRRSPA
jgi:colanic acid/amylovoran biosynthesis glycosyltransferase